MSCREKDAVISELKEKVVRLNGMVRQLEAQVKELHNLNMQVKLISILSPYFIPDLVFASVIIHFDN